jgi:hypothetical protein
MLNNYEAFLTLTYYYSIVFLFSRKFESHEYIILSVSEY